METQPREIAIPLRFAHVLMLLGIYSLVMIGMRFFTSCPAPPIAWEYHAGGELSRFTALEHPRELAEQLDDFPVCSRVLEGMEICTGKGHNIADADHCFVCALDLSANARGFDWEPTRPIEFFTTMEEPTLRTTFRSLSAAESKRIDLKPIAWPNLGDIGTPTMPITARHVYLTRGTKVTFVPTADE